MGCRSRIFFSCGERKPSSLDTMESGIIAEGIVSIKKNCSLNIRATWVSGDHRRHRVGVDQVFAIHVEVDFLNLKVFFKKN